jgi:hypothetical protein
MLKQYFYNQTKSFQHITAALIVLIIAGIGTYLIIFGHASTPYAAITADSGSLTAPAIKQACAGTSTGNCVQFGGVNGSCLLSSFSATNQPACWQPFTTSSPLNSQLPANPKLASYSSQVINHLITYNWQFSSSTAFKFGVSTDARPVYFAHPTDPLIKLVSCSGSCKDQSGASIVGASFHIPLNAVPGSNSDSHTDVIETDTGDEYGFWQASVNFTNDTMTANNGDKLSTVTGSGVQLQVGADAAHIALSGGLVRPAELLSGVIKHALVLDVPCVANGSTPGIPSSVYPALYLDGSTIGSDGCVDSSKGDGTPYGSLLKLNMSDADIAASGAPSWEKTIMTAMAHYGAYVSDTQSVETMFIFRQSAPSWTNLNVQDLFQSADSQLGGSDGTYYNSPAGCVNNSLTSGCNYGLQSSVPIPISKFEVIAPCVPQKTC